MLENLPLSFPGRTVTWVTEFLTNALANKLRNSGGERRQVRCIGAFAPTPDGVIVLKKNVFEMLRGPLREAG